MKRTWIILALFVTGFAGFALADCPEGHYEVCQAIEVWGADGYSHIIHVCECSR